MQTHCSFSTCFFFLEEKSSFLFCDLGAGFFFCTSFSSLSFLGCRFRSHGVSHFFFCLPALSKTMNDLLFKFETRGATASTERVSGFRKAGIVPFSRRAFEEHEFPPVFATDLSHPEATAKNDKNLLLIIC